MDLADIHLVFFLSRAVPFSLWDRIGILEREIALYKLLSTRLGSLSVVTCGGEEELAYQDRLGDIRILYNRWRLSANAYSLLAPFLHWADLRSGTVYKTNQLDGAWTAIIAGKAHNKPVIVRAGYLWAEFFRAEEGRSLKASLIRHLQAFSLKRAHRIILTTGSMIHQVGQAMGLPPERTTVIPNYVDTARFRPAAGIEPIRGRICYIGRLHPRKNLRPLVEAIGQIPGASLVLIGAGEQRQELERLARCCEVNARFAGILDHDRVPLEIQRSEVVVLPSLFEGHPKALIEAMACGAAVVGADVGGIRGIIRHGQTGLLCSPTVEGIAAALRQLLGDAELRKRLGRAARAFVEREYSLKRVVEMESAVLRQVQDDRLDRQKSPT